MSTRLALITRFAIRDRGARYLRLGVKTRRMMKGRKHSMYRRLSKLGGYTFVWFVKFCSQLMEVALAASTTWKTITEKLSDGK